MKILKDINIRLETFSCQMHHYYVKVFISETLQYKTRGMFVKHMPMGPLQIFSQLVGKGLQDILNYYLCMTHLQNFNSLGIKRRFREDAEGLQDVILGVHLA